MEPPEKPDESDCCNSGCNPCILDVYEEQLKKYENSQLLNEKPTTDRANCMKPTSYAGFRLTKVVQHTPNTSLLTFEYSEPEKQVWETSRDAADTTRSLKLFCEPGQHFLLKATSRDGRDVFTRAYTPIPTPEDSDLRFTILVRFYEDGRMCTYLRRLKPGDLTFWRGPYGDYALRYDHSRMLCIVQGVGVAPIFAIANRLVQNEDCFTFVHVFCCYRSGCEILLREELYKLASNWNFTYEVFLSDGSGVTGKFGENINKRRLRKDDIAEFVRSKGDGKMQVLICGSDHFSAAVQGYVEDCNVADVFVF